MLIINSLKSYERKGRLNVGERVTNEREMRVIFSLASHPFPSQLYCPTFNFFFSLQNFLLPQFHSSSVELFLSFLFCFFLFSPVIFMNIDKDRTLGETNESLPTIYVCLDTFSILHDTELSDAVEWWEEKKDFQNFFNEFSLLGVNTFLSSSSSIHFFIIELLLDVNSLF